MTTICITQAPAQCHHGYSSGGWCPQYDSSVYTTHAASPAPTSRVSHITNPSVTVSAYVCPAESVHTQSSHAEGMTSGSTRQIRNSGRPSWTAATGCHGQSLLSTISSVATDLAPRADHLCQSGGSTIDKGVGEDVDDSQENSSDIMNHMREHFDGEKELRLCTPRSRPLDRVGIHDFRTHTETAKIADVRFPYIGKPIALKLMCANQSSHEPLFITAFEGYPITSEWEVEHIMQVTEVETGVHRDAQKLYHAGREMALGYTIRRLIGVEEQHLPDRFTVHMIVDEDRFPEKLGPFSSVEVPLRDEDFTLPKSLKGGFHWMMKNEAVERHGVRSTKDAQVTAQCSPTHAITLSHTERAVAGIPEAAVEFAWSNPVANWEQVERDPHLLEDWALCAKESSAVKDFLVVGGFIFLDEEQRIVKVTTVLLNTEKRGGLQFGPKRKWDPAWTKALIGDGRFHRVTIGLLKQAGAQLFCWLRPGEIFESEDGHPHASQPNVPHGGFAYLFHEMSSMSAQELAVDCYFPIECMTEHTAARSESFTVVGEECLSELVGHTSAQLNLHNLDSSRGR